MNEVQRLNLIEDVEGIKDRIAEVPHLARVGNWFQVVNQLISLHEVEANLEQLWVWNRFCWAFGRRNTWRANDMLDNLFNWYVIPCSETNQQYERTPWWRWLRRRKLRKTMVDHTFNLMLAIHKLMQNDREWNDREAFMGYAK